MLKTISIICPECDRANAYNTDEDSLKDVNVPWLQCAFCNRKSNTDEWIEKIKVIEGTVTYQMLEHLEVADVIDKSNNTDIHEELIKRNGKNVRITIEVTDK